MIIFYLRKKVIKIKIITKIILLIIILYTSNTYALYTTNNNLINTLHTINYNFQINALGGTYINNDIVINKNKVLLPIPIKEGYSFSGYTNNNNIYNQEVNILDINNKELKAKWDLIEYSITYNLNDGIVDNNKIHYNTEEEFLIPNTTREGYIFLGWTGSNGDYPEKDIIIKRGTTGNLEYIANWQELVENIE